MADRPVHLVAAQHQLDRPPDHPGGEDAQHLRPGDHALRAEAAAEEGAADMDLLRREAEQPGDAAARHLQALARHVDRQRNRRPRRRRWHAAPSRCDIAPASRRSTSITVRGRREARFDVALATSAGDADADAGRHEAFGVVEPDARRLGFVSAAPAAPRPRSPLRAFRRSPPRSAGWRSAPGRSAGRSSLNMNGLLFSSGSCASAGRLAGVITSTTPLWPLAACHVQRRHAAARDAADRHRRRKACPADDCRRRNRALPVTFSTPSRRVSGWPMLEPWRRCGEVGRSQAS